MVAGQHQCPNKDISGTESKKVTTKTTIGSLIIVVLLGFMSIVTYYWTEMSDIKKKKITNMYQKYIDKMSDRLQSCPKIPEVVYLFLLFFLHLLAVLLFYYLSSE